MIVWALSGLLIGIIIGVSDALVLVLEAREMFFDAREMGRAAAWTLGISAGAGVAGLTVLGIAIDLSVRALERARWRNRQFRFSLLFAALFVAPAGFVLWRLTEGPQASQLPGRLFIVAGVAALSALAAAIAAVQIPRWAADSLARRRTVALLSLLATIGLYVVDLYVLVRLYPIFHWGLTGACFVVGGIGLRIWLCPTKNWKAATGLALVTLTALALGSWSLYSVGSHQNSRFVIGERTAAVSDLLILTRRVAPPPLNKSLDTNPLDIAKFEPLSRYGPAFTLPDANLFLLTVDAMRYDRLALLGAKRPVAPNMDKLAASSVVFTRAYSPIPHTSHAISSLLTGKYTRPLIDVPGAPAIHETWPEILRRFRYKTAGFFTKAIFFIDRPHFEPYIRSGMGFGFRKIDYLVKADERASQLIAYLEEMRPKSHPIFAWAHFFDAHEPYDPECRHFGHRPQDRYDCEIWKVDHALGRVFNFLDEAYPGSIIIVTSDHGEEFEDHGGRFHGTTLYDEQIRVPLLIRLPGIPHRIVDEPVSLVDLLGTSLTLLDIPVPARVRSRDLTGLMMGQKQEIDAFAEVHDKAMLVRNRHKLICDFEADLCRLYNLAADPGEKRSQAGLKPELLGEMKARLNAWQRSHARFELRPIETEKGAAGWPKAVQKALGGDKETIPGLISLIREKTEPVVRRKAAELLYKMWGDRPLKDLILAKEEPDAEVAAWLSALAHEAGDREAAEKLALITEQLEPLSDAWRAAALSRLDAKDKGAIDDVARIAIDESPPVEERLRAIDLLGKTGRRSLVPPLIKLINNYQLTLEIADALGRLKDRRAVVPLITRLRRERFTERKAAIIKALFAIGDPRASGPIAEQLWLEKPPDGALKALALLGRASTAGRSMRGPLREQRVRLYSRFEKTALSPGMEQIERILVRTSAHADGGRIVLLCNEGKASIVPLFSGEQEAYLDMENCNKQDKDFPNIHLQIDPEGLDVKIDVIAFIGK